jgi:hypothetical protein
MGIAMIELTVESHNYWYSNKGAEVDIYIDQLDFDIRIPIKLTEFVTCVRDGLNGGCSEDIEKIYLLRKDILSALENVDALIKQKPWESMWGEDWKDLGGDKPSDELIRMMGESL